MGLGLDVDNNNKTIRYCLKQTQKVSFPGSDTFPHSTEILKYKNNTVWIAILKPDGHLKKIGLCEQIKRSRLLPSIFTLKEKNATSNNRILINVFV